MKGYPACLCVSVRFCSCLCMCCNRACMCRPGLPLGVLENRVWTGLQPAGGQYTVFFRGHYIGIFASSVQVRRVQAAVCWGGTTRMPTKPLACQQRGGRGGVESSAGFPHAWESLYVDPRTLPPPQPSHCLCEAYGMHCDVGEDACLTPCKPSRCCYLTSTLVCRPPSRTTRWRLQQAPWTRS